MKYIKRIIPHVLLLGCLVATFSVLGAPKINAQAVDSPVYESPGCYLVPKLSTTGVRKIDCEKYKRLYPSFNPDPAKCYFGWDNGLGATKPVSISCKAGPISTTPVVYPVGDVPGGDPAPSAPPAPVGPGTVKYAPGCYVEVQLGFMGTDCAKYKLLYPSFYADPAKCYFGWTTGYGVSPPVQIDCEKGPGVGSPMVLPLDNIPGNGESTAAPPPPAKETIEAKESFETTKCNNEDVSENDNCILDDINTVINVLSAGVGVIVIITIMTAGIQYAMAGGDPQKISQAKNRIRNAVFALLAFAFLFAFLQWIVPGGIIP